ncbi:ubiquinone/menaquinone biosynthesis C-methylase UbiE [Roseiarcus fermentans]|uniref:Ubiquinone/menaquinone biosynthesis C-methylase UbiE n=1 Tax=Roseiarcus fermentans TaxID=1473586 RepID=A0A366EXQ7_9HYPH|nr:class I SAM-dependent methyltransferase [Roseiarcus fermentans]RBP06245.1 ubiquinone/menaquinone biosynthesis C-methylase UbiE [Roseiarcus fermentans]
MSMASIDFLNTAQAAYWNGAGGRRWADHLDRHEALFRPISDRLIDVADARPGEFVLDIGCGSGATTIEFAARVAPEGEALGVDVSETLLRHARERAPEDVPARFIHADATLYEAPPGEIDLVASRFGVMFFADPTRSFANLRAGMKPGGRLAFACWRAARENPWMIVPLRAAAGHAPPLPELGPEDPGPFAFADENRVRRILFDAGFLDVDVEPEDYQLDIALGGGLDAAVDAALSLGPASRMLEDQPEPARAAAAAAIRDAFARHADGDRVPLGAAVWFVTARNPD